MSPPGPLHLSDSLDEFTPASNYSDPYPSACHTEKTDVAKPEVKACDPFFPSFAEPSIAPPRIPDSPDVHPSSPTSRLSVSPGDSPSQRRLLVGSSPPPAVVVPKVRPPPQSPSNPRRVLKKSSPPSTKCLPKNDLRHRLIAGAVPSNVTDEDVEVESTRCYLKGQHDLLVKLKRVCQDSEETSQPSSPPPPQVADVRHVIIQDSPQPPSFVEVPSSSPSSQCVADSLAADENTKFALKVLRETFHRQAPASPPRHVFLLPLGWSILVRVVRKQLNLPSYLMILQPPLLVRHPLWLHLYRFLSSSTQLVPCITLYRIIVFLQQMLCLVHLSRLWLLV